MQVRLREEPLPSGGMPLPDEFLLDRERLAIVAEAMNALDPNAAELLRCKDVHGWSYHRIGAELGMNQDAVTNGLRRARGELRERIRRRSDERMEP